MPTAVATELRISKGTTKVLVEEDAAHLSIRIEENATLTLCRVFAQKHPAHIDTTISVIQEKGSVFESHMFQLGEANVVQRIDVSMEGPDSQCHLNGLYVGHGDQRIENRTTIDHHAPRTLSRELYKGILDDKSQAVFEGLITVRPQAQKADSIQTNKNLLLSDAARANSNPELKIFANDVKCKHGATIGQIDSAQLFYLRSRGIPFAEARKVLIYAFASEMIDQVRDEALRKTLQRHLHV